MRGARGNQHAESDADRAGAGGETGHGSDLANGHRASKVRRRHRRQYVRALSRSARQEVADGPVDLAVEALNLGLRTARLEEEDAVVSGKNRHIVQVGLRAFVVAETEPRAFDTVSTGHRLLVDERVAAELAHPVLDRLRPKSELTFRLVFERPNTEDHAVGRGRAVLVLTVPILELDETRRRRNRERPGTAGWQGQQK